MVWIMGSDKKQTVNKIRISGVIVICLLMYCAAMLTGCSGSTAQPSEEVSPAITNAGYPAEPSKGPESSGDAAGQVSDNQDPAATPVPTGTPVPTLYEEIRYTRQAEDLDRGLVALTVKEGVFVSWRILGTDSAEDTFTLYRNGEVVAAGISGASNYLDGNGKAGDIYRVEVDNVTVSTGDSDTAAGGSGNEAATQGTERTRNSLCGQTAASAASYIEIPLNKPETDTLLNGETCDYTPNDASVGDIDGDGEYEIILKWDPSNSHDNAHDGLTGRCYIDAYELDGTFLWRVNLGINIRSGAHYTQFMVYDFDGDGKAEMICKTSDGSVDGKGNVIGDGSQVYLNMTSGKILRGNEYLTLFDGRTGEALDTIPFEPARESISSWGDDYANRSERYLAAVAYLNGVTPSCIMSRGYYARTAVCAYNVVDKKLQMLWKFDTKDEGNKTYTGQGNHNLAVADVDGDGYDEICFGQLTINEDGTALACTHLGHGDAMHAGDLVIDRQGIEAWGCLEGSGGAVLWDPLDATVIYRVEAKGDTGRGTAGNFYEGNRSYEFVSSAGSDIIDFEGNVLGQWPKNVGINYAVYWDADLEHEIGDGNKVYSVDGKVLLNAAGCTPINGTKSNTCLTADILGDWREEIMLPTNDGKSLRIYVSTDVTDVRLFTLMHDTQYRCQVAAQNVAYNQGALPSFFLGTGFNLPDNPDIYPAVADRKMSEIIPASEMFLESYFAIIKERLQTYSDDIIGNALIRSDFALYDTPYNAADYADYDVVGDKVIFTFSGKTLTGKDHPEFTYECELSEARAFMLYDTDGRPINRPAIRELDTSKKMIALTFDDGPNVQIDPQLNEVLLKHNALATFFINTSKCGPDSYKESLLNLKAAGHEIANHEYSHLFMNKEDYDRKVIWTEVNRSNLILAEITGEAPRFLRLPGGCNIKYFKYLPMPYIHWSYAALDWENRSLKSGETKEDMYARKAQETYNNITKHAEDGGVMLLHVNYPEEPEALERILNYLDAEGYIYVTLSEMFYYKGVTPQNGVQYKLIYKAE